MSSKSPIPVRPIDFDLAKRAVDEIVVERKVPTQVVPIASIEREGEGAKQAPAPAPAAKPRPQRSPTRNFTIDLPDYVIDALHARTVQTKPRCTVRSLVLQGLRAIGFDIKDIDMVPDARRRPIS
ncbi:MAG: hypothetical protein AB7E70_03295 [Hyphomicrobiaceae bacterium]